MKSLWKILNSPFGTWFLGTVIVGVGVFLYQLWTRALDKDEMLRNRASLIDSEIAARLAQYSAWYETILEKQGHPSGRAQVEPPSDKQISPLARHGERPSPKFLPCVKSEFLIQSIRSFARSPGEAIQNSSDSRTSPCLTLPRIIPVFTELRNHTLLGLLFERISIAENISPIRYTLDEVGVRTVVEDHASKAMAEWNQAVDGILDPQSIPGVNGADIKIFSAGFQDHFYQMPLPRTYHGTECLGC